MKTFKIINKIIFTIYFRKKSSLKKYKKITYIQLYIKLCIIIYEQFFLHFSKLIFF